MLYRLAPGAGPGSFGVHVGRLAGLPPVVLAAAVAEAALLRCRLGQKINRSHAHAHDSETNHSHEPRASNAATTLNSRSRLGGERTNIASAAEINSGAAEIASATADIASGTAEWASSATQIASRTTEVSSGATEIASGATEIASGSGATETASGSRATEIASGSAATETAAGAGATETASARLARGHATFGVLVGRVLRAGEGGASAEELRNLQEEMRGLLGQL